MSAVVGSVARAVTGAEGQQTRVRFGNVEPALLALSKQLDPLVAVLTLFGCVLLYGERMSFGLAGVAMLTFLVCGPLFIHANRESGVLETRRAQVFWHILWRWGAVVTALLYPRRPAAQALEPDRVASSR